eukprot:scaffold5005_cov70-Phaeocystis_antarctica.AAC.2
MLYRSMLSLGSLLLAVSFHGTSAVGPDRVLLGTAGDFAILTKAGVTTTGVTSVTGNVGTSPIAATGLTGFGLTMDSTNTFSKSTLGLVSGQVKAASYTSPTPSDLTTAISNMETAFTDAAGRPTPDYLNKDDGILSPTTTLEPGLYKWGSGVDTAALTFDGTANDVWILQMSGNLNVAGIVTLVGGALAENIFWQVSGSTTLHETAHMQGTILCATSIVFKNGAKLNGKALAQTAVTLDAATIVKA